MSELDNDLMVGVEVVAKQCLCSARRIQQGVREGWMPRARRGKYPLISCMHARIKQYEAERGGAEDTGNLYAERVKMIQLERQRKELELKRDLGDLIDVRHAAELWAQVLSAARLKLLAVPGKVAPMIKGRKTIKEIRAVLRRAIDEAIEELRDLEPTDYVAAANAALHDDAGPGADDLGVGGQPPGAKSGRKRRARKVAH